MNKYSLATDSGYDHITAPPWRWKFSGNAGSYFLYGNDGKGPITHTGPDSADGRLKQAAPALLAVLTEPLVGRTSDSFADDLEAIAGQLEGRPVYANNIRAKAQAIRAAIAEARGSDAQAKF